MATSSDIDEEEIAREEMDIFNLEEIGVTSREKKKTEIHENENIPNLEKNDGGLLEKSKLFKMLNFDKIEQVKRVENASLEKLDMTNPSYKCWNCNRFYMKKSCLRHHIQMECGKTPDCQCRLCHCHVACERTSSDDHERREIAKLKCHYLWSHHQSMILSGRGSNAGGSSSRGTTSIFQPVRTARGQSSFKCPNCNRFYKRASCLKRHLRMECGKAPNYQCRICHGRFTYKHNLAAHMKLHVEEPSYNCALCPKKFYRRDKLVEHEKKWHNIFSTSI